MTGGRGPAAVLTVAGSAAVLVGLVLMVLPPVGTADVGAVPAPERTRLRSLTMLARSPGVQPATTESTRPAGEPAAAVESVPVAEPPTRLEIPARNLRTEVVEAPVGAGGRLEVPADPRRVGWWIGGALPGATAGTLVIAGHVDDRVRVGALFDLRDLPVGTEVVIVGTTRRYPYRLVARRSYPRQDLPAGIFDRGGIHRLVLITCGGAFHDGHYDDNVVVYAEPTSG
jgi:hypothetical protein